MNLYQIIEETCLNEKDYNALLINQRMTNEAFMIFKQKIDSDEKVIIDELKEYLHLDNDFKLELDKKNIKTFFIITNEQCECMNYVDIKIKHADNGTIVSKGEKLLIYINNGETEIDIV